VNLGDAAVVLRPRSLAESVDLGITWCVHVGRGTYVRLALVLLLPAAIGCWSLHVFAGWDWVAVWCVAAALASFLQAPFTLAAGTMMFEREVAARVVLRRFVRQLPTLLAVWLMSQIWLAIGLALAVVGAAWTWPQIAFTREVVLLEGQGAGASMTRARGFVSRQSAETLGLVLTQGVIVAVVMFCFDQLDLAVFDFALQAGRPFGELADGGSLFTLVGLFAAVPVVSTIRFLRYIDGRTRRDGWDLQLAFLALRVADDAEHPEVAT
jgi:hypothetical protein